MAMAEDWATMAAEAGDLVTAVAAVGGLAMQVAAAEGSVTVAESDSAQNTMTSSRTTALMTPVSARARLAAETASASLVFPRVVMPETATAEKQTRP